MAVEFDIGTNSVGNKLGSALQEGLNSDVNKLKSSTTTGKITSVISGSGSTEEKTVGVASTVISSLSTNSIGNSLNTVR